MSVIFTTKDQVLCVFRHSIVAAVISQSTHYTQIMTGMKYGTLSVAWLVQNPAFSMSLHGETKTERHHNLKLGSCKVPIFDPNHTCQFDSKVTIQFDNLCSVLHKLNIVNAMKREKCYRQFDSRFDSNSNCSALEGGGVGGGPNE